MSENIGVVENRSGQIVIHDEAGRTHAPPFWKGVAYYLPSEAKPAAIEQAAGGIPGLRKAWRGSAARSPTYETVNGGFFKPASAWSAATALEAATVAAGLRDGGADQWRGAGGAANAVLMKYLGGGPRHDWQRAEALTEGAGQGQQLVTTRTADEAVYVDREAAYLHGWRSNQLPHPMAFLSGAEGYGEPRGWRREDFIGMLTATVQVPDMAVPPLPAMPASHGNRCQWPTGTICGTWTAALLRQACDLGCRVVKIWRYFRSPADTTGYGQRIADAVERLRTKHLRAAKALYVRLYGMTLSVGSVYQWSKANEAPARILDTVRMPGSALRWKRNERGEKPSPLCRPEIGAAVAADNQIQMNSAIAQCEDEQRRILAAHVDCLIIQGATAPNFPGRWKVKASGAYQGWSPGVYQCGEYEALSGIKPGEDRAEYLLRQEPDAGREWNGNDSQPHRLTAADFAQRFGPTNPARAAATAAPTDDKPRLTASLTTALRRHRRDNADRHPIL